MDQAVDAKIIKAIGDVRKNTVKLTKAAFNSHGQYNYVAIDTYYQKIVPLASDAGLIWRTRETNWEMLKVAARDGNDKFYIRCTYVFDLYTEEAAAPDFMAVTVCSPLTGPQTAGQMYSYADKVFMRVTFSVATGESDGDDIAPDEPAPPSAHDPVTGEMQTPAAPRPSVTPPGQTKAGDPLIDTRIIAEPNVQTIIDIFRTWMPNIPSRPRLHDWHAENLAAIEKVGKFDRVAYEEIKSLFNARNTQLKETE